MRVGVRETTVPEEEIVAFGPVRVTSPARTVIDVALLDEPSEQQAAAVRMLLRSPGVADRALTIGFGLGHTPGKRQALDRIHDWMS